MYKRQIVNTGEFSKRGKGDKYVVKFKDALDELPELEGKDDWPTWRRMAMCIIKNDFLCKSLSFTLTKEFMAKRKATLEKYRNIL